MCLFMTSAIFGQGNTTASLNGKVLDNNGDPLPGANVVAIHVPSGTKYGSATDFDGLFRISNMRVGGPYTITISYVGFNDFIRENVSLQLGQTFRVNAKMVETSNTLEEVVITAQTGSVFDGNKTGIGTNIDSKKMKNLPTTSRSIADFVRLTPQANITEGNDGFSISIAGQNNRYNTIFVDGAVNNDVFGLAGSGTNGGQTGVSPFSIDAIESFQVSVAPFNVKLSGFAGGAINAITRSGTNKFIGSVYGFYRDQNFVGKTPPSRVSNGGTREKIADFTAKTYGIRLGGPIVKDKVFFFVNYERQEDDTPQPFDIGLYRGDSSPADLENLRNFLITSYNYDPGPFNGTSRTLESDKITAKFDFNIDDHNKLSLSYRLTQAKNLEARRSGTRTIRFSNGSEFFDTKTNSGSLEWNFSTNKFSNNLIVTYTQVRDDRDPSGDPFPSVRIGDGLDLRRFQGITFGAEPFSTANLLDQDIFTISDNIEFYRGAHTFTIGTHNEFSSIKNIFNAFNFGEYQYNTVQDFITNQNPFIFQRGYSLVDNQIGDNSQNSADFSLQQYGLYFQDEVQVSDNFKLSVGVRFDIPVFDDGTVNDDFNDRTIPLLEAAGKDLKGARVGQGISSIVHVSPRIGFNWNVNGEYKTQIRGGLGVFTSRIPLVWPGGTYNNNGTTGGFVFRFRPNDILFNPDVTSQPVGAAPGSGAKGGNIDLFAPGTKLPQRFRVNLAIDQKLPWWGLVFSADILYNDHLQDVYYENLNLKGPVFRLTGTGDNRLIYNRRDEIDDTYGRIILGSNTTKGESWNATVSLSKTFQKGFSGSVSYTYGDAKGIFDGTSSQNSSQWRNLVTVNGKNSNLPVTRSDFSSGSRITSLVSYEHTWKNFYKFKASLFYTGQQGRPFSYIYDGRLLNDDSRDNALVYVPLGQGDINLVDILDNDGNVEISAQDQWTALNAFIEGNDYLRSRRGKYVERNGDRGPWSHVIDAKFSHEIFVGKGDNKHSLELTFDIFNLTNLINKDWGKQTFVGGNTLSLLSTEGFAADGTTPLFSFDPSNVDPVFETDDAGLQSSRWQMQVGLRYNFN